MHTVLTIITNLFTHPPTHTAARPTAHSSTLPPTYPFTCPPTYPYTYLTLYWFLVISPPMHTYVSGYPCTFAYLPTYALIHPPTQPHDRPPILPPFRPLNHSLARLPTYLTPYWFLVISPPMHTYVSSYLPTFAYLPTYAPINLPTQPHDRPLIHPPLRPLTHSLTRRPPSCLPTHTLT